MSQQRLKNTIDFTLAPGQTLVVPHLLENPGDVPVQPDHITIRRRAAGPNVGDVNLVNVEADLINLTLTNEGPQSTDGSVLVEYWHTVERAFGDVATRDLSVKPFVVVSAQGDGQSQIPKWPVPPVQTTIWANATGNDTSGRGTQAKPYKTFQRAVRDVPYIQMPGYTYVINITNLGEEVLPDGYDLPSWISGHVNGDPGFAVTIQADHELAFLPAKATLASGTMNFDADTGFVGDPSSGMFSINDPSKTYLVDELKGLFVYATSSENPDEVGLAGVVHANSTTEVFVTSNEGNDWTFPFYIKRCTAKLRGNSGGAFSGMITVGFVHSLAINGVDIAPLDLEDTGFAQQGGHIWFTGCHLVNPRLNSGVRFTGLEVCNIVGRTTLAGEVYCKSSRIADAGVDQGRWLERSANQGLSFFRGTCLDGCRTIQCFETTSVISFPIGGMLSISNVLIKNSVGDALDWASGNASLLNVKIENAVPGFSPGSAVVARGGVLAQLRHVTGAGNADVGIFSTDGAQVDIDGDTTVTGTADQKVGTLAAGAYPGAPFSIVDLTYDPTLGAPAQVTGTGARLFRNP